MVKSTNIDVIDNQTTNLWLTLNGFGSYFSLFGTNFKVQKQSDSHRDVEQTSMCEERASERTSKRESEKNVFQFPSSLEFMINYEPSHKQNI